MPNSLFSDIVGTPPAAQSAPDFGGFNDLVHGPSFKAASGGNDGSVVVPNPKAAQPIVAPKSAIDQAWDGFSDDNIKKAASNIWEGLSDQNIEKGIPQIPGQFAKAGLNAASGAAGIAGGALTAMNQPDMADQAFGAVDYFHDLAGKQGSDTDTGFAKAVGGLPVGLATLGMPEQFNAGADVLREGGTLGQAEAASAKQGAVNAASLGLGAAGSQEAGVGGYLSRAGVQVPGSMAVQAADDVLSGRPVTTEDMAQAAGMGLAFAGMHSAHEVAKTASDNAYKAAVDNGASVPEATKASLDAIQQAGEISNIAFNNGDFNSVQHVPSFGDTTLRNVTPETQLRGETPTRNEAVDTSQGFGDEAAVDGRQPLRADAQMPEQQANAVSTDLFSDIVQPESEQAPLNTSGRPLEAPQNPSQGEEVGRVGVEKRTPQNAVQEPTDGAIHIPDEPSKPFYEMSRDEIDAQHESTKRIGKQIEDTVLGDKAEGWRKAQKDYNSSDNARSARGQQAIQEIESNLPQQSVDALYGIGLPEHAFDEVRDYQTAHSNAVLDSPSDASRVMSSFINKLSGAEGNDPSQWTREQQVAYAGLKSVKDQIVQNGWDAKDIQGAAIKRSVGRFSDPNDAEYMLSRFIKKPGTAEAPTRARIGRDSIDDVRVAASESASGSGKKLSLNDDPTVNRDDLGFYYRDGKLIGMPKETTRPRTMEELQPLLSSDSERNLRQPAHDALNKDYNNAQKAWEFLAKGDDSAAVLARKVLDTGGDRSATQVRAVSPSDLTKSRDGLEQLLGQAHRNADGTQSDAPLGLYQASQNRVLVAGAGFKANGLNRPVLAHELLHSELLGKIKQLRQLDGALKGGDHGGTLGPGHATALEAYRELERTREALANNPDLKSGKLMPSFYKHAVSDVDELTSIAMTDPSFRAHLKDVKIGTVTAWSKVKDAWSKMLGLGRADKGVIDHITDQVDHLIKYNPDEVAPRKNVNELGWETAEPRAAAPDSSQSQEEQPRQLFNRTYGKVPETVGYTTAKGSEYTVHSDGTTTRNKAARDDVGHEDDSGVKRRSAKTVYVDGDASRLSAAGLSNLGDKGARVAIKDGKAHLLQWNEAQGRWGTSPSASNVEIHTSPAVGRSPLELWSPKSDVAGHEAYSGMHAGNKIVSLDKSGNSRPHSAPISREPISGNAAEAKTNSNVSPPERAPAVTPEIAAQVSKEIPPSASDASAMRSGAPPNDTIGSTKASIAKERSAKSMDQLESMAKQQWPETYDKAMKLLGPEKDGNALVDTILKNKAGPITADEVMALTVDKQRITNAHNETIVAVNDALDRGLSAKTPEDKVAAAKEEAIQRGKAAELIQQLDRNHRATQRSSSEIGRALQALQAFVKPDYSLEAMMQRVRAARGKDVTPEVAKQVADIQKQLADVTAKLEAAQATARNSQRKSVPRDQRAQAEVKFRNLSERLKAVRAKDQLEPGCAV